jgi:hypothetical protein
MEWKAAIEEVSKKAKREGGKVSRLKKAMGNLEREGD